MHSGKVLTMEQRRDESSLGLHSNEYCTDNVADDSLLHSTTDEWIPVRGKRAAALQVKYSRNTAPKYIIRDSSSTDSKSVHLDKYLVEKTIRKILSVMESLDKTLYFQSLVQTLHRLIQDGITKNNGKRVLLSCIGIGSLTQQYVRKLENAEVCMDGRHSFKDAKVTLLPYSTKNAIYQTALLLSIRNYISNNCYRPPYCNHQECLKVFCFVSDPILDDNDTAVLRHFELTSFVEGTGINAGSIAGSPNTSGIPDMYRRQSSMKGGVVGSISRNYELKYQCQLSRHLYNMIDDVYDNNACAVVYMPHCEAFMYGELLLYLMYKQYCVSTGGIDSCSLYPNVTNGIRDSNFFDRVIILGNELDSYSLINDSMLGVLWNSYFNCGYDIKGATSCNESGASITTETRSQESCEEFVCNNICVPLPDSNFSSPSFIKYMLPYIIHHRLPGHKTLSGLCSELHWCAEDASRAFSSNCVMRICSSCVNRDVLSVVNGNIVSSINGAFDDQYKPSQYSAVPSGLNNGIVDSSLLDEHTTNLSFSTVNDFTYIDLFWSLTRHRIHYFSSFKSSTERKRRQLPKIRETLLQGVPAYYPWIVPHYHTQSLECSYSFC